MANVKISDLPAATAVGTGDLFPVVQAGVTKQVTPVLLPVSTATAAAITAAVAGKANTADLAARYVTFGTAAPDHTVAPVWVDTSATPQVVKGWTGSAWAPIGGTDTGVMVVDNGDGTYTLSGPGVTDNGDGTYTIAGPTGTAGSGTAGTVVSAAALTSRLTTKADLVAGTVPKTQLPTLTKTDVGLGNIDNTADTAKPVSTAQAAADTAATAAAQATSAQRSANLSDLASTATARSNLGLGTAATQAATAFDAAGAATTAQGYAIQRANHTGTQAASTITGLATVATTGAYADLTGKPATSSGSTADLQPADLALKAWVTDPALLTLGTRTTPVAGQIVGTMLRLPADTLTAVSVFVGVAGATVANIYLALLDFTTGNRLAVTADLSTSFTSTGLKRAAFTTPLTAAGGLAYVVLLVGSATTMPQVVKLPNTDTAGLNVRGPGQTTGRIRSGQITSASGLTAIPASNDLSTSVVQNTGVWAAID